MTIAERLTMHGVRAGDKLCQRTLTVASTGATCIATDEVVQEIDLTTELGNDPREATYFYFHRPGPALNVNETLTDADGNRWQVLADREDNPLNPKIRYKVQKLI